MSMLNTSSRKYKYLRYVQIPFIPPPKKKVSVCTSTQAYHLQFIHKGKTYDNYRLFTYIFSYIYNVKTSINSFIYYLNIMDSNI